VILVHVLKNILIPVVTVVGLELGNLIAFSVVTETVFAWPGMGKLIIDSILLLDRPIVVAYLIIIVFMFVTINLVVDILYSLPFIFFVILLVVFFGRNFILMFIAVGAIEWLDMARIVRGQTLSIKRQEYVQAAEALGVGSGGILRRHVVPNTLGPVVIYMTLLVPKVILLESFLSFLGLGVQEPMTSWGVLISEGARNIQGASWMLIFPSLFLMATLFALNFIGDGLRDALDPKDR